MRLDKLLADVTDLTRSQARQLIREGCVTVNGVLARNAAQQVATGAAVCIDGQPLRSPGFRYFMLHKPKGVVCANRDRSHQTVIDLLDEDNAERLGVAGRLDIDTTGLVLLTDDGQWSHRVTAPRSDCVKRYRVWTAEPISEELIEKFARGLFLLAERERLKPARLQLLGECEARLEISEGKYHQVKRMFGAVGNAVVALHREAIGAIELDPALAPGEYRALTEDEIASVG
jgi:16S rRNA pseudouridine516 synthase